MNVLINFSTLKCGGGQNVALNFLSVFPQIVENGDKHCFFLVAKGFLNFLMIYSFSPPWYTVFVKKNKTFC